MNTRRHLNEILAALDMPALAFDANGCARMLFDNEVVVNFECDEIAGQLHLYCDLGPLPENGREVLYRALLEANLFGVQTRGATLAVDGVQNQVVLSRTVQAGILGLSMLSELLEDFVTCAVHWRYRLADNAADTRAGPPLEAAEIGQGADSGPALSGLPRAVIARS